MTNNFITNSTNSEDQEVFSILDERHDHLYDDLTERRKKALKNIKIFKVINTCSFIIEKTAEVIFIASFLAMPPLLVMYLLR